MRSCDVGVEEEAHGGCGVVAPGVSRGRSGNHIAVLGLASESYDANAELVVLR